MAQCLDDGEAAAAFCVSVGWTGLRMTRVLVPYFNDQLLVVGE
jgi:hypothetical protein